MVLGRGDILDKVGVAGRDEWMCKPRPRWCWGGATY